MEFDLSKFNLDELECLTSDEFKSLRTVIEGEVQQLELEMNRVTILLDLLNRKEELIAEVTEGHTRIRSYKDYIVVDTPDTVIISSRSDNITVDDTYPQSIPDLVLPNETQNDAPDNAPGAEA